MLGLLLGMNLWWRIGACVLVLALVGGAVWYIHHSIWKQGYTDAEAVYKPKVSKLETELKSARDDLGTAVRVNDEFRTENTRLAGEVMAQNLSVQAYEAEAIKAQGAARAALAQVIRSQAENQRNRVEVKRLQDIVNGPPLMSENDCEEADSILRTLLRDRVPNARAATPASR